MTHWRERALCNDHPEPDLWYAGDGDHVARTEAVRICGHCPVRAECLTDGMYEDFGIWGGMTLRQRRRIRRNRRKTIAVGTQRRLRALAYRGWGPADIRNTVKSVTGVTVSVANVDRLLRSERVSFVHTDTATVIAAAYRNLIRRGANSSRAPKWMDVAECAGWAPPEAWYGLDIDDPRERPRPYRQAAA